jgi:bifunctional DNase/RNase
MTHDLLANVIAAMGGEIVKIVVSDIRGQIFIATITIRRGDETIEIDSRPSDAIALGVAFDTPIYVAEHVLQAVSPPHAATAAERIALPRARLHELGQQIAELAARLEAEDYVTATSDDALARDQRQLDDLRSEYDAIERVLRKLG